ncbi:MAG: hypothetical protein WCS94_07185 [Verrucomicrobiota bacterium]
MNFTTLLFFVVGVSVGGMLCAFGVQRGWRKIRRETTEQLKSSGKRQEDFYATTDLVYRSALQKLESGDVESAKQELAVAIAGFYNGFKDLSEHSQWIASERREVEIQARSSAILAAALSKKPDERPVA